MLIKNTQNKNSHFENFLMCSPTNKMMRGNHVFYNEYMNILIDFFEKKIRRSRSVFSYDLGVIFMLLSRYFFKIHHVFLNPHILNNMTACHLLH